MVIIKRKLGYSIVNFLKHNVNGGFILMAMAVLAMVVANSPLYPFYEAFWQLPIHLQIGDFNLFSHHGVALSLHHFINDALMAVFFFLVGLEIKRELLIGELSSVRKASLPVIVALGGILVPVLVYWLIAPSGDAMRGAAIPMATDIAFSLGILGMLGSRVPIGLKIFLTAFAVVDDIGGILIIALGYSEGIQWGYMTGVIICITTLYALSKTGVHNKWAYILPGIVTWYLFLQSGIHSTIAGVLVAFLIPTKKTPQRANLGGHSLLEYFEHKLDDPVNYVIMPLFAFANAGVHLSGGSDMMGMVMVATALGLIVGKFVGLFSFTWLFTKLKIVALPGVSNWKAIAGVCMLGGVGFTVSLFIANLAFGVKHPDLLAQAKTGILVGTLVSGILGYCILNKVLPPVKKHSENNG